MSWLEVIEPGPLTTIQDAGRPGLGHLGVAPSGFLDAPAARLANRLVGNPEEAALLETTGSGPTLRLDSTTTLLIAVTGAPAPIQIDGAPADHHAQLYVHPSQKIAIGRASAGLRTYLAVRGGIATKPVLGSRSTDLLSALGSPPLGAGQRLAIGNPAAPSPAADHIPVADIDPDPVMHIYAGPSDSWFTSAALRALVRTGWTVSPTSSRVGLRLSGPALTRSRPGELPPEGMVTGAIQVPPDGQPVLLLADHPTTGGYPVIAVAREADLHLAAQAVPGSTLRFRLLPLGR